MFYFRIIFDKYGTLLISQLNTQLADNDITTVIKHFIIGQDSNNGIL